MLFATVRFLHIIAGIIWGGTAIMFNLTVAPTIASTGDAGKQFIGHLMMKTRFRALMMGSGLVTVLAGSYLYGVDSNWFQSAWMQSNQGIAFGIGGFAGILGFVFGAMTGNINEALGKLGMQIQGKPTPEQAQALGALLKRQAVVTKATTICVFIAICLMASARMLR